MENDTKNRFIQTIITNLTNNGFPEKKVSLPLEKLYEVADNKGLNLNTILDEIKSERAICHEKTADKIIFFSREQNQQGDFYNPEMLKKAQEMMANMDPEELNRIKETYEKMSPKEREKIVEQAKKMGLF